MSGSTLNNQLVRALRSGEAEAVHALIGFSVAPTKSIDLVEKSGQDNVTTRSAWFWSHQAPKAEGVHVWWDWVDRRLANLNEEKRKYLLGQLFFEAMESSLPGNGKTVTATWERACVWCQKMPDLWSRPMMLSYLAASCAKLGNQCVPGMVALETEGLIHSLDWSDNARQRYARDPMTQAVSKNQVNLVEALLDMGCSPTMQSGEPIIQQVWSDCIESIQADNSGFSNMEGPELMLEKLLQRGVDLNVPTAGNPAITVADDIVKWLDLMKANASRWGSVCRFVEARILSEKTMEAGASKKKSRRL